MSDKVYRRLIGGVSIVVALGMGLFFGKSSSGQKSEYEKQTSTQLVLAPKSHLPSEDARWTLTPDVPVPRILVRSRALHYTFHCASPDIPMHIANGTFGFVLAEPEEDLPAVGGA